jgi:hypothetical protein
VLGPVQVKTSLQGLLAGGAVVVVQSAGVSGFVESGMFVVTPLNVAVQLLVDTVFVVKISVQVN